MKISVSSVLVVVLVFVVSLFLEGCCPKCIKPTVLPQTNHPSMLQVQFDPNGEYCLGDTARRDMLINLEMYRASLEDCRATIEVYNESIK